MLYDSNPITRPSTKLLVAGTPSYLFGSYSDRISPTAGTLQSDSGDGATSTVTFQIISGNIPVAGALVTIRGTANASVAYNVENVAIATVSCTDSGLCTITFSNTANSATHADAGEVLIPQPEVAESLAANVASAPVAAPYNNPALDQGKAISVTLSVTVLPTTANFYVQGADIDLDSEYQDIALIAAVVASTFSGGHWMSGQGQPTLEPVGAEVPNLTNYRFYRVRMANLDGGPASVIAKIET